MNPSRLRGDEGERAAAEHLVKRGYTILERNYFSRYGEIDIIARKDDTVVFAEVKTGTKKSWDSPAHRVSAAKQKKLVLTAETYIQNTQIDAYFRFDVIQVILSESVFEIEHIRDAFLPQTGIF